MKASVVVGPVVWLVAFGANFALSGWTCAWQSKAALYILSGLALLLTAFGTASAWISWRTAGRQFPGESNSVISRERAIAIAGIGLNAMFFIALIAQLIPQLMLAGCE